MELHLFFVNIYINPFRSENSKSSLNVHVHSSISFTLVYTQFNLNMFSPLHKRLNMLYR
jgi:hypothetical protein